MNTVLIEVLTKGDALELRLAAFRGEVLVKEELLSAERSESGELAGLLAVLRRLRPGWPLRIAPLSAHVQHGLLHMHKWSARHFELVAYPEQWSALAVALEPHRYAVQEGFPVVLERPEPQLGDLLELLGCASGSASP